MKSVNFINQTSVAAIPTITVRSRMHHPLIFWETRNTMRLLDIDERMT